MASPAGLAPIVWLEPAPGGKGQSGPPLYQRLASPETRAECERLVRNEPADFMRGLVAFAWKTYGVPASWREKNAPLIVVLKPGGNNAAQGFRLETADGIVDHPDMPYVLLEPDASSLSDTLLHEGGHLLHHIATKGTRRPSWWTAVPHTTFAVSDPVTALAEGFAIHLETLLGHYGSTADKRAYYHRLSPKFDLRGSRDAEYFVPVRDLMTFSQSWARYQGVRDGLPVFAGHVYPGDYLRSQFDPQRDRAVLKTANAMLASEGVVASALFWTAVGLAEQDGAKPGMGLGQPGIAKAEQALLAAFAGMPAPDRAAFRPDAIDLISALGVGTPAYRMAASRWIDVTRGVTVQPALRAEWQRLYRMAVELDIQQGKALITEIDAKRAKALDAAALDATVLRAGLGPIIPVRAKGVELLLKAFGEPFPLEFDLNAATAAELAAVPALDQAARTRMLEELEKKPFASFADFEQRTGINGTAAGLGEIKR